MLAVASRKRRRCEPAIQPRQSACYSLQAPGLPVSHSTASGLRQGRHRPCQGTTKNLISCCIAVGSPKKTGVGVCERMQTMQTSHELCTGSFSCSYIAVLSCASAVSDHAALPYRIIKLVVGSHASIHAIHCTLLCEIIEQDLILWEKESAGALIAQHQCSSPTKQAACDNMTFNCSGVAGRVQSGHQRRELPKCCKPLADCS